MSRLIDPRHPFRRRCSPRQKDDPVPLSRIDQIDNLVRKSFPPRLPMRIRFMRSNSERRIQQQDSLLSPIGEIAVGRNLERGVVGLDLFVDVAQRRWNLRDGSSDGEREAHRLIVVVVRILTCCNRISIRRRTVVRASKSTRLTENDHSDVRQRREPRPGVNIGRYASAS